MQGLLAHQRIRRLLRGVFVASQVPDSHGVRIAALALVAPAGSVATDWTACWIWTGVDQPNAHIVVPPPSLFVPAGAGRLRNPLCASGERSFLPTDLVALGEAGRLQVTSPIRTAWDLGRRCSPVLGLGAIDALLRHGTFTVPELVGGIERFKRHRGVVQLRRLGPLGDGRAESLGESALRLHWLEAGDLPRPEPQVSITDQVKGTEVYRIDLGVEELRYGAEYDGERWHDQAAAPHDAARRVDLRVRFRWTIDAFRRDAVFGAQADAIPLLRQGVDDARRRAGSRVVIV